MSLSRQLILSFILLVGYSASACSQAQTDTDSAAANAGSESTAALEDGAENKGKAEGLSALMSGDRLAAIIERLDDEAIVTGNSVVFKIAERELMMVYDSNADRMRVISPIIQISALPEGVMERILQANYDAVLDARYAFAQELVWAVFIHPLSSLTETDFISGLAQTVTAAESFGTTYTSGAMVFGGGDSSDIHGGLLEELEEATKSQSGI